MKLLVVSMVALSFATSAFAQEWPKQNWALLQVTPFPQQAPASSNRDGGAYPPQAWMTSGDAVRLRGPPPGSRQTVAVNLNSVARVGHKIDVQYFVWTDGKAGYTEITSQVDCSKTGEQIVLARHYDRDFAYVRASNEALRRTDARARAIATYVCGSRRDHGVDGKSLPELVRGG